MSKTEKQKVEEAKAKAKATVGSKLNWSVDTIKFKKGGGSGIVFDILSKATKPLSLKELTSIAIKKGIKNPGRAKTVVDWFASHNIATKVDGKYSLKPFTSAVVNTEAPVETPSEVLPEAQAA